MDMHISDLNDEKVVGIFYKKEMKKASKTEFRVAKVIKWKGDRLWKTGNRVRIPPSFKLGEGVKGGSEKLKKGDEVWCRGRSS